MLDIARPFVFSLFSVCCVLSSASAMAESPYAGLQDREIKALSDVDIEGFLTGKGMGYAKAAELNHYPGPRHVLDMADELKLSPRQIENTKQLFDEMQLAAIDVGKKIITAERKLDSLFASQKVKSEQLATLLEEIGALQSELRFVHLSAHLKQKVILSKQQVQHYDRIRGYHSGQVHDAHQHTHQH